MDTLREHLPLDRTRLALLLVAAITVPLVIAGLLFSSSLRRHRDEHEQSLGAFAFERAEVLDRLIGELRDDALAMSRSPYMAEAVVEFMRDRHEADEARMARRLEVERLASDLDAVMLVDPGGSIVASASSGPAARLDGTDLANVSSALRRGGVIVAAHLFEQPEPHLDVVSPVFADPGGSSRPVATIVERVTLDAGSVEGRHASATGSRALLVQPAGSGVPQLVAPGEEWAASLLSAPAVRTALAGGVSSVMDVVASNQRLSVIVVPVPSTEMSLIALSDAGSLPMKAMRETFVALAWPAVALALIGSGIWPVWVRRSRLADSGLSFRKGAEEQMTAYQEKLRALAVDLAETEERERRRLAASLHDRAGQTLTLLRMQIASIEGQLPDGSVRDLVREADSNARRAIHEVRVLTCEISPPVLYELGLVPAIEWLADQMEQRFGVSVRVEAEPEQPRIAKNLRGALFAAVRELLMNVMKHAKASEALVAVSRSGDRLVIDVVDDGAGFDTIAAGGGASGRNTFGLFSISERIELMGGRLTVRSSPGDGTHVRLDVPLAEEEAL